MTNAILRAHGWVLDHWPESPRRRVAVIAAIVAIVVGSLAAIRPLGVLVHDLDPIAYAGLAIACWIGAGGALVPIPGIREVSWVMVVHQGAALDPLIVLPVAAAAMALGQTSYYAAARVGARTVTGAAGRDASRGVSARGADGAGDPAGAASDGPTGPADPGRGEAAARRSISVPMGEVRRALAARTPARITRLASRAKDAVDSLMHVHPGRAVFLVSVIPTPLTTFASATAGALGVGFSVFFLASFAGFLVLTAVLVVIGQGILGALGIRAA